MPDSLATKRQLADSLKKQMKVKPLEKISVSDICEDCNLNRKSFYYHFKDKYDLVNWIFDDEFLNKIDPDSYEFGWDMIQDVCDLFYNNRDFYLAALERRGQNSFHDYVFKSMHPLAHVFFKDIYEGVGHGDFFVKSFGDAVLSAIMLWLSEGMQMDSVEFIRSIKTLTLKLANQIIEDDKKLHDMEKSEAEES